MDFKQCVLVGLSEVGITEHAIALAERWHVPYVSIDGLIQDQRFFLSWATIWRTKYRDEALKTQIKTDPHSPAMYRAIGPLSNFDKFYDTYGLRPGDKDYRAPEDRVRIW